MNIELTVGLPVYNGAQLIRSALESLSSQTFRNFEIIISDNCSNDSTQSICLDYSSKYSNIHYFRQTRNLGAVENFQFVFEKSRSTYFMWAAHDDLWHREYLLDAFKLIENSKDIDFVFPLFSLESILLPFFKRKFHAHTFNFIASLSRKERILSYLNLHHYSYKCNIVYSLFRRDFLKKCLDVRDISDDGLLGAVILSQGRGLIADKHYYFNKRYLRLWPGHRIQIAKNIFNSVNTDMFLSIKHDALKRLIQTFPEFENEITSIFDNYDELLFLREYQIIDIKSLLGDD